MVKGYLVRRLMKTTKLINLKQTIRDTSMILINFKQNLITDGILHVTQEDVLFHKRLCNQLEKSCKELYSVFFHLTIKKQMQMISRHREHLNILKEKRSNSLMSQLTT